MFVNNLIIHIFNENKFSDVFFFQPIFTFIDYFLFAKTPLICHEAISPRCAAVLMFFLIE